MRPIGATCGPKTCVPLRNASAARWRNDILSPALERHGLPHSAVGPHWPRALRATCINRKILRG